MKRKLISIFIMVIYFATGIFAFATEKTIEVEITSEPTSAKVLIVYHNQEEFLKGIRSFERRTRIELIINEREPEVEKFYEIIELNSKAEAKYLLNYLGNRNIIKHGEIYNNNNIIQKEIYDVVPFEGSGTENEPYKITNAEQLNKIRFYNGCHFELENDIEGIEQWTSIEIFMGSLNGNNFAINEIEKSVFIEEELSISKVHNVNFLEEIEIPIPGMFAIDPQINADSQSLGGLGTITDPYIISTKYDLLKIKDNMTAYYRQENDIIFEESDFLQGGLFYNNGLGFEPIGKEGYNFDTGEYFSNAFAGNYDGRNYTISNLYINNTVLDCNVGLFGIMTDAQVKNLNIRDANITGKDFVGGIVGCAISTTIENCSFSGNINGTSNVGGIVGGCDSDVTISKTANFGTIIGNEYIAGISGYLRYSQVSNSYNIGKIIAQNNTAGITGEIYEYGSLNQCYNKGRIICDNTLKGGLVGAYNLNSLQTDNSLNNYYLANNYLGTSEGDKEGAYVSLSESQFSSQISFIGFDFSNVWIMNQENLPILIGMPIYAEQEQPSIYEEKKQHVGTLNLSTTFLTDQGEVFTWGDNNKLQLGNPTFNALEIPKKIENNFNSSKVVKLASGEFHTLALNELGELFVWGDNEYGQLGDGTNVSKATPFKLSIGEEVISNIAAAGNQSFIITKNSKVYSFGRNNYGQLGDGTEVNKNVPTEITSNFNGEEITNIIPAPFCTFAISKTNKIYAWGFNTKGNLGDGTNIRRQIPYEITHKFQGREIKNISAGYQHAVALTTDNKIFVWGNNEFGQLGIESVVILTTPTILNIDNEEIDYISGEGNSCAVITKTGKVYVWGRNNYGQLGDGTNINKTVPTEITNKFDEKIKEITIGAYHSMAYSELDEIYMWGHNTFGQLGEGGEGGMWSPRNITQMYIMYGTNESNVCIEFGSNEVPDYKVHTISEVEGFFVDGKIVPVSDLRFYSNDLEVDNLTGRIISGTQGTVYAIEKRNDSWAPQFIGESFAEPYIVPFNIITYRTNEKVVNGVEHSAYLNSKGDLFVWGSNYRNQLSETDTSIRETVPVDITNKFNGEKIIDIASGNYHMMALTNKGKVYTWGFNLNGQLGNGNNINGLIAKSVAGLEKIVKVEANGNQSFAINQNGEVYAWGLNSYGQLGNGEEGTELLIPTKINLTNVKSVEAGSFSTFAITNDNKVYAWGYNTKGNLGDGTKLRRKEPYEITSQFGGEVITKIEAGSYHAMALSETKKLYTWGDGSKGQTLCGTGIQTNPTEITSWFADGVSDVFVGGNSSIVITNTKVWTFGENTQGQLGVGDIQDKLTPIEITSNFNISIINAAISLKHSLFLENNYVVHSTGNNQSGQLGTGNKVSSLNFKKVYSAFNNPESEKFDYSSDIFLETGTIYKLSLQANNMLNIGNKTMTIYYDPQKLELTDFCGMTPKLDIEVGVIKNTKIEILSHSVEQGKITFKYAENSIGDKGLNGIITIMSFQSKVADVTNFKIETKEMGII